jgi:hypothetical protein
MPLIVPVTASALLSSVTRRTNPSRPLLDSSLRSTDVSSPPFALSFQSCMPNVLRTSGAVCEIPAQNVGILP